jgi:predicted MFS family arabinose efflux permease
MMAVIGTLAFNFQVVIPLMATKVYDTEAGGFGILLAIMGAGAVLGGLSMATRKGVSYRRLLTLSTIMGVMILFAAAAPTLGTEAVALFAMGASSFAFIAVANTTIQLTAAPEMRGRVMSLYAIAFLGSTPIGGPIVGWISQQWGPRMGFAIGGFAALLATAWAAWTLLRYRADPTHRPGMAAVQAA